MRSSFTLLIGTLMLIVSLLGTIQLAAARAEPYSISGCLYPEEGHVYCYEDTGVVQYHESPSGTSVGISNSRVSSTLTIDGELVETRHRKSHFVQVGKGSQAHVDGWNGSDTFTYIDPATETSLTCTYTFVFVYANGDIRHEDETLECS
jgi:hypothetical protein